MKIPLLLSIAFFITINCYEQELTSDFKVISVQRKVREFPDKFDLSSSLNSFITLYYIYINGKDKLLRFVNTIRNESLFRDSSQNDSKVNDKTRERYLNVYINEVIVYKDSIAFVISESGDEVHQSYYSIRSFYLEAARWVTSGESARLNIEDARQFVKDKAGLFFEDFQTTQNQFYRNN